MRPRRTSTRLVLTAAALGVRAASTALPADALRLASSLYMLSSPPQLVALVTGGGAQLAPWLLATPGASNSILEFSVPYAKASLAAVLGHDPPQSVNAAVAESMAERAYERSVALGGGERSVGLGCTAALRSEPMRRGEHRCYIAVRSAAGVSCWPGAHTTFSGSARLPSRPPLGVRQPPPPHAFPRAAAGVHCLALTLAKGARSREARARESRTESGGRAARRAARDTRRQRPSPRARRKTRWSRGRPSPPSRARAASTLRRFRAAVRFGSWQRPS